MFWTFVTFNSKHFYDFSKLLQLDSNILKIKADLVASRMGTTNSSNNLSREAEIECTNEEAVPNIIIDGVGISSVNLDDHNSEVDHKIILSESESATLALNAIKFVAVRDQSPQEPGESDVIVLHDASRSAKAVPLSQTESTAEANPLLTNEINILNPTVLPTLNSDSLHTVSSQTSTGVIQHASAERINYLDSVQMENIGYSEANNGHVDLCAASFNHTRNTVSSKIQSSPVTRSSLTSTDSEIVVTTLSGSSKGDNS